MSDPGKPVEPDMLPEGSNYAEEQLAALSLSNRCGHREPAKPWGSGYIVCRKIVGMNGKHKGPHEGES